MRIYYGRFVAVLAHDWCGAQFVYPDEGLAEGASKMGRLRNARAIMARMGVEGRAVVMAQASALPMFDGLPSLGHCSEDVDSRGGLPKDNGYTSAGPCIVVYQDGAIPTKINQILGVIQRPTKRKI